MGDDEDDLSYLIIVCNWCYSKVQGTLSLSEETRQCYRNDVQGERN